MKSVLITGSNGFIAKNLIAELKFNHNLELFLCDYDTSSEELGDYTKRCDFVFHLAGVNRPQQVEEYMTGNYDFTEILVNLLKEHKNHIPILFSSSIQAELDNPYGRSKLAAEKVLRSYGLDCGADIMVFRLANVFGKWCKPNYNSVVATFCHNIANEMPIEIQDSERVLSLVYIDDVVQTFLSAMQGKEHCNNEGYYSVEKSYTIGLKDLAERIYSFRESRKNLMVPDMAEELIKKLYSTYLSYLPTDEFSYPLKTNSDVRGSFTEFLKFEDRGQVSINVARPGITKGNHWHHTKNEKFLVVTGKGMIRLRHINSDQILTYQVSGDRLEVVDIPVGYTHNISNTGDSDLVTIMWANEPYDPERPDTYILEV